jgi:hypothetical protein
MTTIDSKLVETLAEAIREGMNDVRHNRSHVERLVHGTIEIDGEFDLSIVARACLTAIEAAGFKLVPA